MNETTITCGLDFGTSNSVISLVDRSTGRELYTYDDRSILYFPETNDLTYYVGKEAQEYYVKEGMRGRLLKSVKTLLKQDKFLFTWICGKRVTPDQLAMFIIKHMKEKAEAFLGSSITEVVLGRPAIFSEDAAQEAIAVKRLMMAARAAGFTSVRLQLEPIAAAFSYEMQLSRPERVLVADFGGGTSDFTIMNLSPEGRKKGDRIDDIVGNSGVYIGGDLFDSELMWHKVTPHLGRGVTYRSYDKEIEIPLAIFHELKRWERSFLLKGSKSRSSLDSYYFHSGNHPLIDNLRTLIDQNYTYSLFKSIEQSKMGLSDGETSRLTFVQPDLRVEDVVERHHFGEMIARHIEEIDRCMVSLFEKTGVTFDEIDSVFITGGSSFVHPVRQLLYDRFTTDRVRLGDAFNSVAYGLALN